MATVLAIAQRVCQKIGLTQPSSVFGNSDRSYQELAEVLNDMGERIARAHYWQTLKGIATITGDGSTTAFNLPSDYSRQDDKAELWSAALETPLTHITTLDKWLELEVQDFDFVINAWTIYGDQLHVKPALGSTVTAQYAYLKNTWAKASDASFKTAFDNDTDEFRLDDDLLRLGAIWQWRESKGLPYAEDMSNYERRLSKLISQDKGSRTIRIGANRLPRGVRIAYPQAITGS